MGVEKSLLFPFVPGILRCRVLFITLDKGLSLTMTQRCGYIAIMGRPNAGKSSLLNTLVGQKIAGVSAKPQTTRSRILGIRLEGDAQLLFLDTPGIHRQQRRVELNSMMNREAWSVLADADAVLYLIDGSSEPGEEGFDPDRAFLRNLLRDYAGPVFLCLNKCDKMKKDEIATRQMEVDTLVRALLFELGEESKAQIAGDRIWTVSAKRRDSLDELLSDVSQRLPEGPWLFPEDDLTDRPQKFVVSELIREQAFRCLGAELPYHLAVRVEEVDFEEGLVRIYAELIVGRSQHKGIVLGKGGSKIKEIGSKARVSLELHFSQKVFLKLEVIVDEGWVNDRYSVAEYSEFASNP